MNEGKIISEFNAHKFDLRGRKSGKLKTTCPFCSSTRGNPKDRSLSVDIDGGVYYCHHCNKTGQLHKYNGNGSPNYQMTFDSFWERREISPATLKAMDVSMKGKGIRFPYIKDGKQVNVKSRSFDKGFRLEPGKPIIPYNIDCIKGATKIIITEGEIDALTFIECGFINVISVPTGANTNLEYLKPFDFTNIRKFYIASDDDSKGRELTDALYNYFGVDLCVTVKYRGCKDVNEMFCIHGKQSVEEALEAAQNPLFDQLDELEFDINSVFEDSTPILYVGEHEALTLGNFSVIHGKKKAGKGFFETLLINAYLNVAKDESMISGTPNERKLVVILDTEQSPNMAQRVLKRVDQMGGKAEKIKGVTLRPKSPEERLMLTELTIKKYHDKCALFFIDGIRDLAQKGINDEVTATNLSSKLLKWTIEYNIHIVVVIHQNKSDGFARGHLGSELVNKAETVFAINLCKNDPETREVIAEDTRNMPLADVFFTIENNLPVITNRPVSNEKGNEKIKPDKVPKNDHKKMIEDFIKDGKKPCMKGYLKNCIRERLDYLDHGKVGARIAEQFIEYWVEKGWVFNDGNSGKANYVVKVYPS